MSRLKVKIECDTPACIISYPEQEHLSHEMAQLLGIEYSLLNIHRFPDGESCIHIDNKKINRQTIVISTLYNPDTVTLSLLFLSRTLRDYGAEKILLVVPYLAYMRQDIRFSEGEGISARYYAELISRYYDALITVDPHLHRIKSLDEIFSIPTRVVHASPLIAEWIRNKIDKPLLIGPDSESHQWVSDIANRADAPFIVLDKIRYGDHDVKITVPEVNRWKQYTPVLADDIISTGRTMIETITHLKKAGLRSPVCMGVHGIFSDNAEENLISSGASDIVTSNTIPHSTNAIDLSHAITKVAKELLMTVF